MGLEPVTYGLAYPLRFSPPPELPLSNPGVCGLDYIFTISGGARIVSTDPRSGPISKSIRTTPDKVSSVLPSPAYRHKKLVRRVKVSPIQCPPLRKFLIPSAGSWSRLPATEKIGCRDKAQRPLLYPVELRAQRIKRKLVGVERFELPTSCSQSRRATRLRYTPDYLLFTCTATKNQTTFNIHSGQGERNIRIMPSQVNVYYPNPRIFKAKITPL